MVLKGPVTIVYSFEDVDLTHGEGADDENAPYSDDARSSARADLTRVYEPTVARVTTSWAGVAGSGDVLAGLIAGILARPTAHNPASTPEGARPLLVTSARLSAAVSLHASAAQTAAMRREGRAPIQARDIADAIPEVLAALSL